MQIKLMAGDHVRHASKTDWGVGQVLADECGGKLKVFFEAGGLRELHLEFAKIAKVTAEEAQASDLAALILDYRTNGGNPRKIETAKPKRALKKRLGAISFPAAVQTFLTCFPSGFADAAYLAGPHDERTYKLSASALLRDSLACDVFTELLRQNKFKDVCDRAKSIVNKTNLVHRLEKTALAKGLAVEEHQEKFARSLCTLLYGREEMSDRFRQFAAMLSDINAANWPIATYFLFLAYPDSHVFVDPEVTKHAAKVMDIEINYRPDLSWVTYSSVRNLAQSIDSKLREDGRESLRPRDMIDVQAFVWVTHPDHRARTHSRAVS